MTDKGNQHAIKHGGEGAIRRISEGKPFLGLAADEQKAIEAELQASGQAEIVKGDAIRLQTAANLYWNAVMKAAQDGDIAALDRYVARYGWLSGVTLRAWQQVAANDKAAAHNGPSVIDVIQAMKDKANE